MDDEMPAIADWQVLWKENQYLKQRINQLQDLLTMKLDKMLPLIQPSPMIVSYDSLPKELKERFLQTENVASKEVI